MEIVAPAGLTPAPFALSPSYNLLAVGMASSPAARGDAAESASRVEVLRLLRPGGDLDLGRSLKVDCVLHTPGLRRVAWSAAAPDPENSVLTPVDRLLYPAGLIAGGFQDGTVRVWSPEDAMLCDLATSSVTRKEPVLILSGDPRMPPMTKADVDDGVSIMHSEIKNLSWKYSQDKEIFQINEEESSDHWHVVEDDAAISAWDVITKDELPLDHHDIKQMTLLAEARNLNGPVLGLSFNQLYPSWIATGGLRECICVHDLCHPIQLYKKKVEFCEAGEIAQQQITCLKWSPTYPCALGSTGDGGFLNIWDIRRPTSPSTTLANEKGMCSSDLEFSLNNLMQVAVSTVNNGKAAAVKIWDMRNNREPFHEYGFGGSGVVSLSWNQSGLLLASHTTGAISCYDVYKKKMMQHVIEHCDLGVVWTHQDDVAATLSSQKGVTLCGIEG